MAYEKSWQFQFSLAYAATTALDYTRYQLWALKAMLCGQLGGFTGTGLWTVYSSSDSVTAGNADGPGTDRWLSTYDGTKIVRGSAVAVRSWIVLKSPVGLMNGNTFYLTISFDGTIDTAATAWLSKQAPTGGTTSASPTGGQWLVGASAGVWNAGAITGMRLNMCLASDGSFYYFPVQPGQGFASLLVAVIAPVGCQANDSYPIWTYKYYGITSNVGATLQTALAGGASSMATFNAGGTAATLSIPTAVALSYDSSLADTLTSKFWTMPAWVTVFIGSVWHARGRLPDTLIAPSTSTAIPYGTIFRDNTGAIAYISIGPLIIPVNSVPVLR